MGHSHFVQDSIWKTLSCSELVENSLSIFVSCLYSLCPSLDSQVNLLPHCEYFDMNPTKEMFAFHSSCVSRKSCEEGSCVGQISKANTKSCDSIRDTGDSQKACCMMTLVALHCTMCSLDSFFFPFDRAN